MLSTPIVCSCGIIDFLPRERRARFKEMHMYAHTYARKHTHTQGRPHACMHTHPRTRTRIQHDFISIDTQIEETLTSVLDGLSEYYTTNQLRANPTKTQVSLFHLRNRECGKQLNISWNGENLTHCNLPVYLGVALDRKVLYKAHIEKIKKKVGTRNNITRKLRNSTLGSTPTTLRSSALALCYSVVEYVWCGNAPPTQTNWTRH